MAELDKIPQTQTQQIEIATVKLDEDVYEKLKDLSQKSNLTISDFGQIYIRKKEIKDELQRLDEILEKAEESFKDINLQMRNLLDEVDEKYPQSRVNMNDGTVQYQPGAPTRKQMAEQQQQQGMGK